VQEPLVKRVGVPEQLPLAEVLAVVRGDEDECVVQLARVVQSRERVRDPGVELPDRAVV
jgi:hypothetical protein